MYSVSNELAAALDGDGSVVVPGRHAFQALRLAHSAAQLEAGRAVWRSPRILPFNRWLERLLHAACLSPGELNGCCVLSAAQERRLWQIALSGVTGSTAVADQVQRSAELLSEYRLPVADDVPSRALGVFHAACLERRYVSVMHASESQLRCALMQSDLPVTLAGFARLTPRQQWLLDAMSALGQPVRRVAPPRVSAAPRTRVLGASDFAAEVAQAAQWCRELLLRDARCRLLVVTPDLERDRPLLQRVFTASLMPLRALGAAAAAAPADHPVRFDRGVSAILRPPIEQALRALQVPLQGAELAQITALLHAPSLGADRTRSHLDLWLRDLGQARFEGGALEAALQRAPPALAAPANWLLDGLRRRQALLDAAGTSLRGWAERFGAVVDGYGWPGAGVTEPAGAEARGAVAQWRELLGEFASLEPTGAGAGEVDRETAFALLHELLETSHAPPIPGDAAVTVLDRADLAAGLQEPVVTWDGMWILGMDASRWPLPARPDPLLGVARQRAAGLPLASVAARLAEGRRALEQWTLAAPHVVLSWSRAQLDVPQQPSPLLGRFAPTPSQQVGASPTPLAHCIAAGSTLERFSDAMGTPWHGTGALPGGVRTLALQGDCAFRAHAQTRFRAEPLRAPGAGLDPRLRGVLLHRCLESLWLELRDSRSLQRCSDQQRERAIGAAFDRAVDEARTRLVLMPDDLVLERERRRTVRALRDLLALEARRSAFEVQAVEQRARLRVDAAELTMRLDRVDRLEDGSLLVIDYKSGAVERLELRGERPRPVQLLSYASALDGARVAGLALFGLRRPVRMAAAVDGPARLPGAPVIGNWAVQRAHWRSYVEQLVRAFVAGDARVNPQPQACRHCHLPGLCRIDALRIQDQLEEGPHLTADGVGLDTGGEPGG